MRKFFYLTAALLLLTLFAHADTLTVDQSGQGDFASITAAVAAANPGDTLRILPGVYDADCESFPIIIDKALTLCGEAGVVLDSPRFTTLMHVVADDVVLQGLQLDIRKWGVMAMVCSGLRVESCTFRLADAACRTSSTAVWMEAARDCTFTDCAFEGVGICMAGDPLNPDSAGKAVLTGLCEVGEDPAYFVTHHFSGCTVNGKPLYYIVEQQNVVVPEDAGGMIVAYCEGVTVRNADVSDSSMGLEIVHCSNVRLENVRADRCGIFGTYVAFVTDGVLERVQVHNTNHGIDTRASSRIVVRDCLAEDCDQGIFWSKCEDSETLNCTVNRCGFGYFAAVGEDNRITGCTFTDNADGIYLQNENTTLIRDCVITGATVVGLRVLKSSCTAENVRVANGWTGTILHEARQTTLRGCVFDSNESANVYMKNLSGVALVNCEIAGTTKAQLEVDGTLEDTVLRECVLDGTLDTGIRAKSAARPEFIDCLWR